MRKIINGKKYDTETAKEMWYYQYGDWGDLFWWSEFLYRKRTGELFLYGIGGGQSKYAKSLGNGNYTTGDVIYPLTTEEALEYCENMGVSVEIMEKLFGEFPE